MKYRIHFTDYYGSATIETESENYDEVIHNLIEDPMAEDIWVESYNEEEGYWEA